MAKRLKPPRHESKLQERKRLFKAALAFYGLNRKAWAETQDGLAFHYFEQVQLGFKDSPRVEGLIDATITQFVADVAQLASRSARAA